MAIGLVIEENTLQHTAILMRGCLVMETNRLQSPNKGRCHCKPEEQHYCSSKDPVHEEIPGANRIALDFIRGQINEITFAAVAQTPT